MGRISTNNSKAKTRAEIVRERRARKSTTKTAKKASIAQSPAVNVTPITSRRGQIGTPVVERTRSRARRQVSIPLNTPGAELRVSSLPAIGPGWRILSGMLAIFLIVFLVMLCKGSPFQVSNIEYSGLERLRSADLNGVIEITGKPIFLVNSTEIQDKLDQEFPELTDIEVKVEFPAMVMISLNERTPVLEWRYGNLIMWIDEEGVIFPVRGEAAPTMTVVSDTPPPRLPTEEDLQEQASEVTFNGTFDMSQYSGPVKPTSIGQFVQLAGLLPENSQVTFSQNDGYGFYDPQYDWHLYLGFKLENLDQKFNMYETIREKIMSDHLNVSFISVANLNNPYFHLEY